MRLQLAYSLRDAALAGGRVERGKVVERELVWEIGFISISSYDAPIITCASTIALLNMPKN